MRPVTSALVTLSALCATVLFSPATFALPQGGSGPAPIRVESNLIVVPAGVYDKGHLRIFTAGEMACDQAAMNAFRALPPTERHFLPKNCEENTISGLSAGQFHIFEDGIEQKIESVVTEPRPYACVRDNLGRHVEWSFTSRGKWSAPDRIGWWCGLNPGYFYSIRYAPAKPDRGCHKVAVKVDHRRAAVFANESYCYSSNPASDPLTGTKFGQQAEGDLARSAEESKISLSLQTTFFFAQANTPRVDIAVEIPGNRLKREWQDGRAVSSVGALGLVYRADGAAVVRFSDLACCFSAVDPFIQSSNGDLDELTAESVESRFDRENLPTRYETQLDLPAGQYDLQIVVSDGSKFGRVETPLTIERHDENQFALSSIALCKRVTYASAAIPEAADVNLAPQYIPLISKGLEFTPTGDTTFGRQDSLFAYYEIYDPLLTSAPGTAVQTRMRIINTITGALETDTGLRSAADWMEAGKSVIPVSEQVAAAKLAKGSYRIEVQASDSAGRSTAWRTATFTVE